jgi:hypothetical protein
LTPQCNDLLHPTLRLWHKWLTITLFPRDDVRIVRADEMRILYAMVRRIKVSPIQAKIRQWLTKFNMTGPIEYTSLLSLIVANLGVTQGPNVPYIANIWTLMEEAYLMQGHILKKGPDDSLVFFYPGYANQIRLLTWILGCTTKDHWPILSRNLVVLVSLVTRLLRVHQGEQPGHNSRHHSHLRSCRLSHRLSLPRLCLAHGPLLSTCLGSLPDMLSVGISPCTSRVRVARLGLVQVVASGPCLPVLPMEMRHLCHPGCAHHLVGLPSLSR